MANANLLAMSEPLQLPLRSSEDAASADISLSLMKDTVPEPWSQTTA